MKLRLLLSILLGFCANVFAQNSLLTFSSLPDSAISLRPHLQILTDESNQLTWEEVYKQQKNGDFQSFEGYEFKSVLERGKYSYWFYFSTDNLSAESENVIIKGIGGESLILFQLKEGKLVDKKYAGRSTPTTDTATIAYSKYDIPITLSKGSTEIFIRYKGIPTHHLGSNNIRLIKESLGLSANNKKVLAYYATTGLFLGILIFVLFFTLFQYFQNRNKAFLFYALYVASILVYYWRFYAMDNPYFRILPDWMIATQYYTIVYMPMFITYVLFLKVFIGKSADFSNLQKVLNLFLGIIIAYIIIERTAMYFSLNWAYRIEKFGRPIFLILGVVLVTTLGRTKNRGPINYILFGTLVNVGIILLGLLITFDGQQSWYFFDISNSISQIGIIAELLCFSLGLGAKTKLIEKDKIQAQLDLKLKQKESESLKELDQLKDHFFTNITHEFRTPLTVIQGLVQQIQENPTKEIDRRTNLIQSNSENLLYLVNQLLDISKADFQKYSIQNTQQDIIKYLSYLTDSFHSMAYAKKINLSFHSHIDQQLMDFDPKIIKTILTNLIGNALKFTSEFGKIEVVTSVLSKDNVSDTLTTNTYLSLKISDTGKGIAAEHLPHIFDRFYQANSADKKTTYGTGIGLALVKELIDLLGGIIKVESKENAGTTFQLYLPITNNASLENTIHEPAEIAKIGEANSDKFDQEIPTEAAQSSLVNHSKEERPLLLIVEDNADVVYYLKSCLIGSYDILEANNGKRGLDLAFQQIPDIILSDVMMPEMDGYVLCQQLKNDARTSHIPIILLTAKVADESRYKGLESGADAYLAKPFDKKELLLRLENLVLLKKQMQLHLQLNNHINPSNSVGDAPIAEKEVSFLNRLNTTVKKALNNELFKAPQLAKAMAMSQTQLYRKIKALTNQSTAQYIKTIRLAAAKNLLQTTDFSVGQIAVEVGFKTQAHFTKSFQEEFGTNPSEMRK